MSVGAASLYLYMQWAFKGVFLFCDLQKSELKQPKDYETSGYCNGYVTDRVFIGKGTG